MLACPYCQCEIQIAKLRHPGWFANYRNCPGCRQRFTVDSQTKQRQAVAIGVAFVSLVLTALMYYRGMAWLIPAVFSYLAVAWLIYRGNKLVFLVPYDNRND